VTPASANPPGGVRRFALRWLKRLALLGVGGLVAFVVIRAVDSQRGPPLDLWHTEVPDEPRAAEIDRLDWAGYLAAEERVFAEVRQRVTEKLPAEARRADNRFYAGSPINPARFDNDWNRSYVLVPEGTARGAVVLLHGLTDAPYSLRHVAGLYRDQGFVAIGLRVPAHGTVPAALTDTVWEDWSAATRLAMREARRRVGPGAPIHVVGFSNGGALALKHALDAVEDQRLVMPDRLILVSPMVGITAFARFAGLAAIPAILPAFSKAAWLGIIPEFNPFKYNSFPVNGARQSWRLTQALQAQLRAHAADGRIARLPPVLTFQSVIDFTVSTRAVVTALYALLPENGSELVLFDRNRATKLGPLLRPAFDVSASRLVPDAPRPWRLVLVTNADETSTETIARITDAGSAVERILPLDAAYPRHVFSLSHVALPFPEWDSLYGATPDPPAQYGVELGTIGARGEVGVLIVSLDNLARMSWNPFFDQMMAHIAAQIPPRPSLAR
jgi:alpha-beta hydrolase superfamily lysophospholipase